MDFKKTKASGFGRRYFLLSFCADILICFNHRTSGFNSYADYLKNASDKKISKSMKQIIDLPDWDHLYSR
jgi:hypothetical protein